MELAKCVHSEAVRILSFKIFCLLFCCIISGAQCQSGGSNDEEIQIFVQNTSLIIQETDGPGNSVNVCIETDTSMNASCVSVEVQGYPLSSFTDSSDFSLMENNLTLCPELSTTQCVKVMIQGDDIVEGQEQFEVVFSSSDPRVSFIENTTTITVIDDDGVQLEKVPAMNIFENSTMTRQICVRLIDIGEGLERMVGVYILFTPSPQFPYAEHRDFMLQHMYQYFNSSSMVNDTICWNFYPEDDDRVEDNETFYFNVSIINELDTIADSPLCSITIYDNDGAMFVTEHDAMITEGAINELCLVTNTTFERNSTITLNFQPMGYANEEDIEIRSDVVTFPAGTSEYTQLCFPVFVNEDGIAENTEHFEFLTVPENSLDYVEPSVFAFHVIDNDSAILLLEMPSNIIENSSMTRSLCVRLNSTMLQREVAINIFSGDTSPYANSDDYYIDNITLIFNSSLVGESLCWVFDPVDDQIPENTETFYFEVRAENELDYFIGSNVFHVSIYDDNDAASFAVQNTTITIEEPDAMTTTVDVCIELFDPGMIELCLTLDVEGYTSPLYPDQYNITPSSVTFCPGSSRRQCVSVVVQGDDIVEGTEQFTVVFSSSNDQVNIIENTTIISVIDNDVATFAVQNTTITIEEPDTMATTVDVCIDLLYSVMIELCLTLDVEGYTSSVYPDQYNITPSSVMFCPGSSRRQCVSVVVQGDNIVEGTEQFTVVFSSNNDQVDIIDNTTIISVIDDDAATFTVQNTTITIEEGDTMLTVVDVCIELLEPTMIELCLTLDAEGYASSNFPDQYNITPSSVMFCPGKSRRQCVSVVVQGDDIVEGTEEFAVIFSSKDNQVDIVDNTTIISVIDDDGVVLEKLPAMDISENSTMTRSLCVRLIDFGGGLERNVHVNIMFLDNTFPYAERRDFSLNNTPQYFSPTSMINETLCWIFNPIDDERVEANEIFSFNVSTYNGLDVFVDGSLCSITIYDNDGAMFVSEIIGGNNEGDTLQLCLATNNTEFERNSSIILIFEPMMVYANRDDFEVLTQMVTFEAGTYGFEQLCFSVALLADGVAENTEYFIFTPNPDYSLDTFEPPFFTFNITDDDGVGIIVEPTMDIRENSTMARDLCVRLSSTELQREVAVNIFYEDIASSFANSNDFSINNMTLVFNSSLVGEALCWTFYPQDDDIAEDTETFYFQVKTENSRDYFMNNSFFHLSIIDDDDGVMLSVQMAPNVTENSTMASQICVSLLDMDLQRDVIVDLQLTRTSSMYAMTDDFNLEPTLVFNSSHIAQTLCTSFYPVDDTIIEDTECFYFTAVVRDGRDTFANDSRMTEVCIIDNDGARLQLQPTANISENSTETRDFCVSIGSAELQRVVFVNIMFDDQRGSDYARSSDFEVFNPMLTFSSSNQTQCALFIPVNDKIVEDVESFYFQATAENMLDYFVAGDSFFHLSIYDDDGATIALQPTQNIYENSTMLRELCVNLNPVMLERRVSVTIMYLAGSGPYGATADDFMLQGNLLEFNSSTSNDTFCFIFEPVNDEIVETNEVFEFEVMTVNSFDSFENDTSIFTVTIYDDDGAELFLQPTRDIFENSTMVRELCIVLNQTLQRQVVVTIMFLKNESTFANGTDFTLDRTSLTFSPYTNGTEQCFLFMPVNDMIVEDSELFTFLVEAQYPRDFFNDGISTFQLYVHDDDGLVLATEAATNIRENSNMTRQLCVASQEDVELERSVSVSLTFISSGYAMTDDFMIMESSVYFHPGSIMMGQSVCFTFEPYNDRFVESNETFMFVPSTGNSLDTFLSGSNDFSLQIYDDDGATLSFTLSRDSIPEYSNMSVVLCISLVNIGDGLQREISVRSDFMPSGYTQMSDFNILNDGYLVFNSSSSNGSTICQYFEPVQDEVIESNETITFNITLANILDMFTSGNGFSFVIIDDDGVVLSPLPTQPVVYIREDSSMERMLCVEITDDGEGIEREIYVELLFQPNSQFTKRSDFSLANYTERFPSSSMLNATLCFNVRPINDGIIEANETFNFEVVVRNKLDIVSPATPLYFLIIDDDVANVYLTPSSTSVVEGEDFTICASLNETSQLERNVSVMLVIPQNSQDDVEILGSDAITFEPTTDLTMMQCIFFLTSNDSVLETPEVVPISVSNSTLEVNDNVIPASLDITILDADFSQFRFVNDSIFLDESMGFVPLCVEIIGDFATGVMVNLTFSSYPMQEIMFESATIIVTYPGIHCVPVRAIDDDQIENSELVMIFVTRERVGDTAFTGAEKSMEIETTATVSDNDGATIYLTANETQVLEGLVFAVCAFINETTASRLERNVELQVYIPDMYKDDIEFVSGYSIIFMIGTTMNQKCIDIQTIDDMLLEVMERVSVAVNESALMDFDNVVNMVSVDILDNDIADVRFEENMLNLEENSTDNSMLCVNVSGMFTSGYELTLMFTSSSPSDISIINATTLVVSASGRYCIYVRAALDLIVESTESHTITVTWMPGDRSDTIPVMITDNDFALVMVEERDLIILEGQQNDFAEICLTLSGNQMLERNITGTAINTTYIQSVTIRIDPSEINFMTSMCIRVEATDDGTIIANDLRRPLELEIMLTRDFFENPDGTQTQTRTFTLTIIEDDSILVEGTDFLPFLNLTESDGGTLSTVEPDILGLNTSDYTSLPIFPTAPIPIGSNLVRQLYVTSEGAISFEVRQLESGIDGFPVSNGNFIAVFLADHDARTSGSIRYKTYDRDSANLNMVNKFIRSQENVSFEGTWMVVAEWRDVPEFTSRTNEVNTYQMIIASDFTATYSIMTYNCDQLQWTGEALFNIGAIGYTFSSGATNIPPFFNHPLSKRERIKMVACSNVGGDRNRPWSNIVLEIGETTNAENENDRLCLNALSEDRRRIDLFRDNAILLSLLLRPCPCGYFQALRDFRYFQHRINFEDAEDTIIFLPRFPFIFNNYFTGFACVYSRRNFALLTSTVTFGTFFFIHPISPFPQSTFNTFNLDIALACCNKSNLCNLWNEQRPSDNCIFYRPSRRTWFFGDPHFETLDGGNYTFNGWGEYTLLQTMDGFMVQGRTAPVNISDSSSATQFSAFAIGKPNTAVEVRINGSGLLVFYNGDDISNTISNINDENNINSSIIIQRTSTSTILVSFANGISISISATLGLLNTNFEIPEEFFNNVTGLLGNYNGDSSDDLIYFNGTVLNLPASDRDIHFLGQSWQIDGSSSLFTYPPDATFMNYSFPNHIPVFLDEVLNNADSTIVSQCDNNAGCIYDAIQTGNIEIGMSTMEFEVVNTEDREELENFPPTISGPAVFQVTPNVTSVFSIQVNDTNLSFFNYTNGPIQGGELVQVDSTMYTFTWTPAELVSSSIIFMAVDQRNATTIYEPIIEVCPCRNNGTCTTGGVVNPSANPLVLNCICTPAWEGQFCERNFNACTVGFCFEGVTCIDNEAPAEGATCDVCPVGYSGDGIKCEDVNECNGTNTCEQVCVNTAGSFQCTCFNGYRAFNSTHCEDIDECLTVGRCHQVCTNRDGSFECSCDTGFQLQPDNFTCSVLPENMCTANNNCSQLCVLDTQTGNENCSCEPGFQLNMEDELTCDNIDECSGTLSPCDQICNDTIGSFNCSCRSGYTQDGNQCNDIDECLSSAMCGASMICNNTDGGFECLCPPGTELFGNICAEPTMPAPTVPPTSTLSMSILENTVVITLPSISVEMFTTELQENFRMEVAMALNRFCTDSNFRSQCSFHTIILSKRQIMIVPSSVVITNIMAGPGGNGTVFYLHVLGVGQATVLTQQAVLNAINNNRQALINAGFTFTVEALIPMTTRTDSIITTTELTVVLTPGEIAGIVIAGVALAILFIIVLASCIYWCHSRSRSGKFVFNTYGRDPSAKSTLQSLHLRSGEMVKENLYATGKDDQSMQSVQLEFTESRSEPSPQPVDPPDYDEATGDKEKFNLVSDDNDDRGLPQLDIRINFIEDADKDTAL